MTNAQRKRLREHVGTLGTSGNFEAARLRPIHIRTMSGQARRLKAVKSESTFLASPGVPAPLGPERRSNGGAVLPGQQEGDSPHRHRPDNGQPRASHPRMPVYSSGTAAKHPAHPCVGATRLELLWDVESSAETWAFLSRTYRLRF